MAAADGVDGSHLVSNLLLVARTQRPGRLHLCGLGSLTTVVGHPKADAGLDRDVFVI
jgi:hypothetical protein